MTKIKNVVIIMKKLIYYNYNYNNYYNTVYNNYKRSPNGVKENGVVLNYLGRLHTASRARTSRRSSPLRSGRVTAQLRHSICRSAGPTQYQRYPRVCGDPPRLSLHSSHATTRARDDPSTRTFIYSILGYSLSNARNKILHKSRILFIIDSD